jgi:hypothetical protein
MPKIGGDNGVSMGGYDYGVATLKYCYISAGSKGCRRPSRYVPYKGTFVPYDGTFGASDQGQMLEV